MLWSLVLLVGCKKVEPAPREFDALIHYVWEKAEAGSDEELAEAIVNLEAATADLELPDGSVSRLSDDEIALVGVSGQKGDDAAGLFMTNAFGCGRSDLEASLAYAHQDELHTTTYETYQRTFDNSDSDWLAGRSDVLTWDVDYSVKYLGIEYDAETEGFLRRVPNLDDELTPFGSFLVARTYFPKPAVFEGNSDRYFEQDYQLEIYWQQGGETQHVYALWREFDFGASYQSESETAQRLLLNELYKWDDETAEGCEEGLP